MNGVLPPPVSNWLLDLVHPERSDVIGFQAYCDKTYPWRLASLLERDGFEIVDIAVNYYQSNYYSFFVPLYVLSALYEMIVQAIRLENLAAKAMIVARKR